MPRTVQTAWKSHDDLLDVREAFFGRGGDGRDTTRERQTWACEMVRAWNAKTDKIPHAVVSTAALVYAQLIDPVRSPKIESSEIIIDEEDDSPDLAPEPELDEADDEEEPSNGLPERRIFPPPEMTRRKPPPLAENFALIHMYALSFARFVTGFTDIHQAGVRKQSMFDIAREINMPVLFIEMRHRVAHEPLPMLDELRQCNLDAVKWVYNYYWSRLPGAGSGRGWKVELREWARRDLDGNAPILQDELRRDDRRNGGLERGTLCRDLVAECFRLDATVANVDEKTKLKKWSDLLQQMSILFDVLARILLEELVFAVVNGGNKNVPLTLDRAIAWLKEISQTPEWSALLIHRGIEPALLRDLLITENLNERVTEDLERLLQVLPRRRPLYDYDAAMDIDVPSDFMTSSDRTVFGGMPLSAVPFGAVFY